jgi:type I restriction enzyme S subunit
MTTGKWQIVSLGEITDSMKNGIYRPASAYADDGVACLRMYNIDKGSLIWRDIKRMRLSPEELAAYELMPGDLLVNRVNSRELVGKAAVIPDGLEPLVFESKNIRLRLNRNLVLPRFVNYQLLLGGQRHFSSNAQQVVGMASISQKQLGSFPVVLPPLDSQERIVAEIETQFSRLDEAVANLNRRLGRALDDRHQLGKRERGALDQGSTEAPSQLPEGWVEAALKAISALVTDGDHNPPKRVEAGIPHLTAKNIRDWRIDPTSCTSISTADATRVHRRYRPQAGDLIVTCVGTVGRTAIVPEAYEFSPDRNLAAVRPKTDCVDVRYLQIVLEAPPYQAKLRGASGSTAQPHLYLGDLRALLIPLPPISEQVRISVEVDRVFSLISQTETVAENQLQRSERARAAILSSAFAGQLS